MAKGSVVNGREGGRVSEQGGRYVAGEFRN